MTCRQSETLQKEEAEGVTLRPHSDERIVSLLLDVDLVVDRLHGVDRAGQLFGRLTDRQLLGQGARQAGGAGRLGLGLGQILVGMLLAKVQFLRLAASELGDMKSGRLITLVTFHGSKRQAKVVTRRGHPGAYRRGGQATWR